MQALSNVTQDSILIQINNQQIVLKPGQIVMVPLAMTVPTAECIYSISDYMEPFVINKSELHRYTPISMKIAPAHDVHNWQWATAYWRGLGDYYLAVAR